MVPVEVGIMRGKYQFSEAAWSLSWLGLGPMHLNAGIRFPCLVVNKRPPKENSDPIYTLHGHYLKWNSWSSIRERIAHLLYRGIELKVSKPFGIHLYL